MDARQKRNSRPNLDRQNALKNVKYDTSSIASSSLHPSASFHIAASVADDDLLSIGGHLSHSLDLPPFFHNQKSFRIKGTDGEFDLICRSLGLSRIDDFSIPIVEWEAHRSNSDLATRLRNNLASSTSAPAPSRLKRALVDLVFAGFSLYFWVQFLLGFVVLAGFSFKFFFFFCLMRVFNFFIQLELIN